MPVARPSPRSTAHSVARQVVRPTASRLSTRSSYQLYSFSGDRRFCYDNHGSFVYDSPNLFCGPSGSVRTGLMGVRSEPGHQTHLTSLLPKFRAFRDEWSNIRVIEHSPLSVQFCKVLARTMHHRIYGVCKFWHAPCTMVRCLYQSIMYAKLTLARLHKNALRFLPAH